MAHTRCMLDKQGYMHVRACTRPGARVPTRTHARTQRPIRNTYCSSTVTMIRERAYMLRYTDIVLLQMLSFTMNLFYKSYHRIYRRYVSIKIH